jgi:hemoglobin
MLAMGMESASAPEPAQASSATDATRKNELCSEDEVAALVANFYSRVRDDELLGPIFARHVRDWDRHLPKMVDFWSSALRRTARYRGTPMPVHNALPGLDAALFARWVRIFRATTAAQGNAALQSRADELAERIAQSLWYGYQLHHRPGQLPRDLLPAAAASLP